MNTEPLRIMFSILYHSLNALLRSSLRKSMATVLLTAFVLADQALASPKPVEVPVEFSVCPAGAWSGSAAGASVSGNKDNCASFDTKSGTAKMVPDKTYTLTVGGSICSTHVTFTVGDCFRFEVNGEETNRVDKEDDPDGAKNAGGTWSIVLRSKNSAGGKSGSGSAQNGSVAVTINLGEALPGQSGGRLLYLRETLNASAYLPAALDVSATANATVIRNADQSPRQVATFDSLADIVPINGGFEVRFYDLSAVTPPPPTPPGSLYGVSGTPFVTWRFSNPDYDPVNGHVITTRMDVSEIRPGQLTEGYLYTRQADGTWLMDEGIDTGAGLASRLKTSRAPASLTVPGQPTPLAGEVYTEQRYSSATVFETTVTTSFADSAPAPFGGRLHSVVHPDFRKDSYSYTVGTYNPATGVFTSGGGSFVRSEIEHGVTQAPGLLANLSTKETTVAAADGKVHREELFVYDGSGFVRLNETRHTYNGDGELEQSVKDGRIIFNAAVGQSGYREETDETGVTSVVYYSYSGSRDATKLGVPQAGAYQAQEDIYTSTYSSSSYNGYYRTAGSLQVDSYTQYDDQSRPTASYESGLYTTFSYEPSALGGTTTTENRPGRGTVVTVTDTDGLVRTISEDGRSTRTVAHWTDAGGFANEHDASASGAWRTLQKDWLGRVVLVSRSGVNGTETDGAEYNNKGQLVRETHTGSPARLYEYDAMGVLVRTGLDLNADGQLTDASTDRIGEARTTYQQEGGTWFRITAAKDWAINGSATPRGVQTVKEQLTLPANTISKVVTLDAGNNPTTRTVTVDRAAKLVTETVDLPSVVNHRVAISRNGLLQSVQEPWQTQVTLYLHDALGRASGKTDPSFPTATHSVSYNGEGLLESTNSPSGSAQYTYYFGTNLIQSEAVNGILTYYDYTPAGQVQHVWGPGIHPRWQEYTVDGQLWKLHTYHGTPATAWDGDTWPESAGAGDVTTWNYHLPSGTLESKEDANDFGVNYTYYAGGRSHTSTDGRSIVTTYGYHPAGELASVSYSDGTPAATFTVDRLGRRSTAVDAAGLHTYSHSALDQVEGDAITGTGILSGFTVSSGYDPIFRKNAVSVATGGANIVSQGYTYRSGDGLLDEATYGTLSAKYGYFPQSAWVNQVAHRKNGANVLLSDRVPDAAYRIQLIESRRVSDTALLSSVSYTLNAQFQREQAVREDAKYWLYGYNSRGEVTAAGKKTNTGVSLAGTNFAFEYDAIGNRSLATRNGRAETYVAESRNQYDSRTVSGAVDVIGTSDVGNLVMVNGSVATRQGTHFHAAMPVDNSVSPLHAAVTVKAIRPQATPANADAMLSKAGRAFVPKTPEAFAHDDAGNLVEDGRWIYTWDAENRLTGMTARTDLPASAKRKLGFVYDFGGRRIQKQVHDWNESTGSYVLVKTTKFCWNGPLLIAELNATNQLTRSYSWGHDLDGTLQGAGGVGGLLSITEAASGYFPCYDGNGNLLALLNHNSGGVDAAYEYGPFGEAVRSSGIYADENPFRFSTKFADQETGLLYYGYRYYQPQTGRWMSRDPLGEEGGVNLYSFVSNSPIDYIDPTGLRKIKIEFNAFIPGRLGDWLPEPIPGSKYEFETDKRGFGGGSARVRATAQVESCDIGALPENAYRAKIELSFRVDGEGSRRRLKKNHSHIEFAPHQNGGKISVVNNTSYSSRVTIKAYGPYAFFPNSSPNIDINSEFLFIVSGKNKVKISLSGSHDLFPNYEASADGTWIYSFDTSGTGPSLSNLNNQRALTGQKDITVDAETR